MIINIFALLRILLAVKVHERKDIYYEKRSTTWIYGLLRNYFVSVLKYKLYNSAAKAVILWVQIP
jgi:hypothetical protein